MSLPDQPPRISKWFFLLSDALLVAVAAFIAARSTDPLSKASVIAIAACVATGALITAWAFIADYTRQQDEALDDRQRALEALARTVSTSAEQISIAANGFHEIAELAQKNLRHAEQLPHKLQEKIAEFQAQLANANDAEREELEKEVAELRTSESERLASISDKIAKSTTEWTKLEAATQKHLASSADAIAKAQTAATSAIDEKFSATLAALDAKLAAIEAATKAVSMAAVSSTPVATTEATPALPVESPAAEATAHPPKRPRKPRREEPAAEEPTVDPTPLSGAPAEASSIPPTESTTASAAPAPTESKPEEPPPVPVATISEIAPIAPHTAEPFSGEVAPVTRPPPTEPSDSPPSSSSPETPPAEIAKPARKRIPKKTEPAETSLSLDITETPVVESVEIAESVRTSDGATRLVVTAYIGIGNRLFIRGEGPGLSWDKGVPLQFVSIGKWRWETNDASSPVKFKLYKNDDTECSALGTQSLDPGQQQEVTASF